MPEQAANVRAIVVTMQARSIDRRMKIVSPKW
jgi:hypothetical protein